ncbi:MAG: corrinoid protein [Ardenticatenaceae bacterium]|nr:corrinoid protein [Ardenticatenaceae bacterium]
MDSEILLDLQEMIIEGDHVGSRELVREALDAGLDPHTVLTQGMIPAMDVVGYRFQTGAIFIPEMLIAARAMKAGIALLQPILGASSAAPLGTAVIGTVQGDVHDIGKNLAGLMLEGAGFKVVDLGVDVRPEQVVQTVRESGACVIGLSALLTTTMLNMAGVIQALNEADLHHATKVLVGGAPVTAGFAKEIGADGYAPDAASGAEMARMFALEIRAKALSA